MEEQVIDKKVLIDLYESEFNIVEDSEIATFSNTDFGFYIKPPAPEANEPFQYIHRRTMWVSKLDNKFFLSYDYSIKIPITCEDFFYLKSITEYRAKIKMEKDKRDNFNSSYKNLLLDLSRKNEREKRKVITEKNEK